MAYETQLIKCEGCGVHISLRGDSLIYNTAPRNRQNSSVSSGALLEGSCPKCGHGFEVWNAQNLTATHVADLEIDRPDVFVGKAKQRVAKLTEDRAAQEARRAQAQREGEERRKAKELARQAAAQRKEEERRQKAEAERAERSSSDDDDWDDDGGRSPNDDRSDSMNPNNDAYWGSRQ